MASAPAQSVWQLGGLSAKELAKRVYREFWDDDVMGRGAQLAYYFMLALFPALFFLTTMLGLLAGPGGELRQSMLGYLSRALPPSAYQLVTGTLDEVVRAADPGKLLFGILGALWAASAGLAALMEGLNRAYEVKEERPWWKKRGIAVALTAGLGVFIVSALALLLYGDRIGGALAGYLGLGGAFHTVWSIIQWPVVLVFLLLAFAALYYFAPNVHQHRFAFVTPGSATALVLWLAASFGFKLYLTFFNSYSEVYGSLGAVMILLLWLWLTGMALLIGGEVNSEIEHAAAERGQPDAKQKGDKDPQGSQHPSLQRA
ncbi:MAG: YihY/virulence factor BrkB family protein [Bryobacteraceae bacterium]|nr:YihY/virulence factor BrkB family protein [Bryobacteraceae bacterium]